MFNAVECFVKQVHFHLHYISYKQSIHNTENVLRPEDIFTSENSENSLYMWLLELETSSTNAT